MKKSEIKAYERPVNQAAFRLSRQSSPHPDFERLRNALFKALHDGAIEHHLLRDVTMSDLQDTLRSMTSRN